MDERAISSLLYLHKCFPSIAEQGVLYFILSNQQMCCNNIPKNYENLYFTWSTSLIKPHCFSMNNIITSHINKRKRKSWRDNIECAMDSFSSLYWLGREEMSTVPNFSLTEISIRTMILTNCGILLTWSISRMHIWENNHYETSNTYYYTNQLHKSVFCLQKEPGEE